MVRNSFIPSYYYLFIPHIIMVLPQPCATVSFTQATTRFTSTPYGAAVQVLS